MDYLNRTLFDQFGFYATGDIGMILPNGSLQIIDRKKNLITLAQGVDISPDKL